MKKINACYSKFDYKKTDLFPILPKDFCLNCFCLQLIRTINNKKFQNAHDHRN